MEKATRKVLLIGFFKKGIVRNLSKFPSLFFIRIWETKKVSRDICFEAKKNLWYWLEIKLSRSLTKKENAGIMVVEYIFTKMLPEKISDEKLSKIRKREGIYATLEDETWNDLLYFLRPHLMEIAKKAPNTIAEYARKELNVKRRIRGGDNKYGKIGICF